MWKYDLTTKTKYDFMNKIILWLSYLMTTLVSYLGFPSFIVLTSFQNNVGSQGGL